MREPQLWVSLKIYFIFLIGNSNNFNTTIMRVIHYGFELMFFRYPFLVISFDESVIIPSVMSPGLKSLY